MTEALDRMPVKQWVTSSEIGASPQVLGGLVAKRAIYRRELTIREREAMGNSPAHYLYYRPR